VSVEVKAVSGGRDLRAFIDLPFRLHANHPLWVPPLRLERRIFLNRRMNAFFSHGEAEYFLARRDGRVVGRISAQVNHAFNDHRGSRWGWFGFLEFERDPEALQALLGAAAGWLRERGQERMVGPASFAMNDESGVLVEGYDLRPMILQPWNPPYYAELLEQAGMAKAIDLLMWKLEVEDRSAVLPVIWELAAKVQSEHGIRVRPMRRRQLRKDMDFFGEVYNAAWSKNWDFVPYSKKDLDAYAQELQLAFDKNWFMIAEKEDDGEVVGMAITVPDLNQVLAQMNGRLLPLGWWKFITKGRRMTRVRVGFLGVKPEYQHTGVAARLYEEHYNAAERTRQSGGEMGWILETNTAMNRGMEAMGGTVVKRYRIYEQVLDPGAALAGETAVDATAERQAPEAPA
jgi:GNAT superfamily N-acetyltransferase